MHAFNEFIVSTIRQAIPVISAVMGAFYGAGRSSRAGGRQALNIAAFAGLGWLGGYVVRSTLLHFIEGGGRQLPATTVHEFPPPPVQQPSAPSMVSAAPTAGIPKEVDPYGFSSAPQEHVATVDTSGSPPPKTRNDGVSYGPPVTRMRGPNGKTRNSTLTASAYGSVYGN